MSKYYYNGFNMVECGTCGHTMHIEDYLEGYLDTRYKICPGCEEELTDLIVDEEDKEYIGGYYDSYQARH
jgi:hypothetical protein